MESALHTDGVREGHTAVTNRVSAQKVALSVEWPRSDAVGVSYRFHATPSKTASGNSRTKFERDPTVASIVMDLLTRFSCVVGGMAPIGRRQRDVPIPRNSIENSLGDRKSVV